MGRANLPAGFPKQLEVIEGLIWQNTRPSGMIML
jgi:hypothetical protein